MRRALVLAATLALIVWGVAFTAWANHGDPNTHVANALTILRGISTKPAVQTKVDAAEAELIQAQNDLASWGPYPSPLPTSPPPTTPPPTSPPPPGDCVGIQVPAGADLNLVIPGDGAQTYCLAAGTYELGTSPLRFDAGDVITGQPVTFGPLGEVTAPTAIHGTAAQGVIEAQTGDTSLTVENLDICCSPKTTTDGATGVGIDGLFQTLINLTVRNSRIHGNGSTGIGHVREGLVVENSEIDHNGSGSDGIDAGIKTVHYAVIRNTYFHDNLRRGMWWDCDAPGGIIENSRLTGQTAAAIHVEISSGDSTSPRPLPLGASYGFVIRNNIVNNNNTNSQGGQAGILVISSLNVLIDGNTTTNNRLQEIYLANDSRAGQGHNGCSSGFFMANNVVQNNQYGPLNIVGCTTLGVTCVNNTKIL